MTSIRLESVTEKNNNYRKVLVTTNQTQLVLMCLIPGEDIPAEVHQGTTQFIRVEEGKASVVVDGKKKTLKAGDAIVIPAGSKHYVKQLGTKGLKLYTLYSPPEHPEGLVQQRQPK